MEQGVGEDYTPGSVPFDKSRVLNVRPLRSLNPIFPNAPNGSSFSVPNASAPFVSATPAGPFPNGTSPYYPFFSAQDSHGTPEPSTNANTRAKANTNAGTPARSRAVKQSARPEINTTPISNAVPLNSFRAGRNQSSSVANGSSGSPARRLTRSQAQGSPATADNQTETESKEKKKPGRPKRKSVGESSTASQSRDMLVSVSSAEIESIVEKIKAVFSESFGERTEGDRTSVEYVAMMYDLFRRRISQFEDIKETIPGLSRRPDLRAGTLFLNKGIRTNSKKRIGGVPGIEVGDIFFFRMELCLVGLHAPSMAGIDYLTVKKSTEEEPLAVSIVSSGGYEDYAEDPDILVYSGQGGVNRKDKEMKDQKLERGNLALEKSLHRVNDVRVIRGVKDPATVAGKIYVYDGLYKIQESWTENAKNGFSVFKYKLVRQPGQPDGFRTWKSIEGWRSSGSSRAGVILPDLTSGEEKIPVSLVNDVDGEKGPSHFTYVPGLKNVTLKKSKSTPSSGGCSGDCSSSGGCQAGSPSCPCIAKNGGSIPYTVNGLLVNQKAIIPECGPSCQCPPGCRNRTSQTGVKLRLEVFKTKNRGWGLRSWDPIRAGSFVCEYAGEVVEPLKINRFGFDTDDDFVFDAGRAARPLGILPGDDAETPELPYPFVISAKESGNVARFMNHSCAPNVFWQLVSRENDKEFDNHVGFYAARHVPPMTELTFDYGVAAGEEAEQRKRKCFCASSRCRGYFYQ